MALGMRHHTSCPYDIYRGARRACKSQVPLKYALAGLPCLLDTGYAVRKTIMVWHT
jgi:hypothetical protein